MWNIPGLRPKPPIALGASAGARAMAMLTIFSLAGGCAFEPPPDETPLAENVYARLGEPIPTVTGEQLEIFERGKAVAERRFNLAEGLGPDFNVTFCSSCHERPVTGGSAGLYRNFFLAGTLTSDGAFFPKSFGGVIRRNRYPTDADLPGFFPPIEDNLNAAAQRSPIPFFGVGLMAEIEDEEILSRADPDDADGDGISGKANFDRGFVGRFGRKSQTVSIEGFIRGPLNNHLGITTNPLSDEQRAALPVDSSSQTVRLDDAASKIARNMQAAAPDGPLTDFDDVPDPEMSTDDLFDLVAFSMLLAAPQAEAPTAQTMRGRQSFEDIGCTDCHVPQIEGPRGGLPIFSDLLLHDMGEELADGIEQGEATGSEFRTQPLWGIASVGPYLHDGRADTLEEAILAHGGEAQRSRDAFADLSESEQDDIVEFLRSLGGRDQFDSGLFPDSDPIPAVGDFAGPFRELTEDERARFLAGRELFDREFGMSHGVGALAPEGEPGRFNGDSCRACHFEPTIGGAGPRGVNVIRHASVDDGGAFMGPATTPNTILHRETRSLTGPAKPEEGINVFEPRQTPHTFGMGLISAIPDDVILANADENDEDGDGISGRAHIITDAAGTRVGRLGWKAQVPNIAEFVRDGMAAELGITLPQQDGLTFGITGDNDGVPDPELGLTETEDLTFFLTMLAAPPARTDLSDPIVDRGLQLMAVAGCDKCHVPSLPATIDGETIDVPLFSDLLLHDVLPEGTAGIVDGEAGQREFRTAPLWGLGVTAPYFHNGMADTIEEAILMHDGEAASAVEIFLGFEEQNRVAILEFLESL